MYGSGTETIHELKTHPEPFEAVFLGIKRYEIRKNDRSYQIGDYLRLREWRPHACVNGFAGSCADRGCSGGEYTGRVKLVRVTYMTPGGTWGLPPDVCVLSIV